MIEYVFLVILAVSPGGSLTAANVTPVADRATCSALIRAVGEKANAMGAKSSGQVMTCTAIPAAPNGR